MHCVYCPCDKPNLYHTGSAYQTFTAGTTFEIIPRFDTIKTLFSTFMDTFAKKKMYNFKV